MTPTLYGSDETISLSAHQHGDLIAIGYPAAHCTYRLTVTVDRKTQTESRNLNWLYNKVGPERAHA